jgi:hypothetical protein
MERLLGMVETVRQFTGWCRTRSLPLFSVRRADIETFARDLEAKGRARATWAWNADTVPWGRWRSSG